MITQNNRADFYIDKINNKENFSFTRWGDGEWNCIDGMNGANCDRHQYFPEMSVCLKDSLNSGKDYYKAIWPHTRKNLENWYKRDLIDIHTNEDIEWVNAIIWEDVVMREDVIKLKNALESRNFIMVSNAKMREIPIKYVDYIEVPSVNCFLDKDRIKNEMIEMTKKYDDIVFGMSSSMATNVIVDELFDIIGDRCSIIDFGSIWDPFIGVRSRSYHSQYKKYSLL